LVAIFLLALLVYGGIRMWDSSCFRFFWWTTVQNNREM
jgi:hypothetical protein